MFKIYRKLGSETVERQTFTHPVDAEAKYFELSQIRTAKPGVINIPGSDPAILPAASFRTDKRWPGNREQEPDRFRSIWATPAQGFTAPTSLQVAGLKTFSGLSSAGLGELCGVTGRQVRYWTGEDARPVPYATWFTLLVKLGLIVPVIREVKS